MIRIIAIKEFKEILREGRFRLAAGIVLALLMVAGWISARQYQTIQEQHNEAKTHARNIWVSQDEKNPHSAAHYGTYAFKPKYPLSLIDQGVDKYAGISIFLEAHKRNEAQYMAAADQTGLSRFGDLTPDFILLFIIPLLIVLIGYNSFTREHEQGTLKLLKSQGVPIWKVVIGKWGGTFAPIFFISLILLLIAAVSLSSLQDFGEFSLAALIVMFAVYLLYYAIFTNITLIVSALSRNSGISLVIMLGIWIVTCLGAPKAASNLSNTLHPYPTRQEFSASIAADKKLGLDGHNPWNKQAKLLEEKVLKEYGVDSLHQLPFNYDGYRMQKGEEHEAQVYYKHYRLLKEQHRKQTGTYQAMAVFSPFLPTRFLSMSIARTDYGTHWNFADAAEKYRLEMQNALNTDFAENSVYGEWSYRADKSLWSDIPDFSYDPPELAAIVSNNLSNFVILLGWLAISFLGLIRTSTKI